MMIKNNERGKSMKVYSYLLFILVILSLNSPDAYGNDKPSLGKNSSSIMIVGSGYVGLVTGTCLAEIGNQVICYDIDAQKIALLQKKIIPIYEPGLKELVEKNMNEGRLSFTSVLPEALCRCDILFIAVGTPMSDSGDADLTALESVVNEIVPYLSSYKLICIKSTVPIGTCDSLIRLLIQKGVDTKNFDVVSNPEFLREGMAIHDFMNPDRIVIGSMNQEAALMIENVYKALLTENTYVVHTSLLSSETIKYASNAFLACKLSFVNEIANLCEKTGAQISDVTYGMGLDPRIGASFLKPGPGFGGSCFPKDCQALLFCGNKNNIPLKMIETALEINEQQKKKAVEKLYELMESPLAGKTVAILGLAFKANTDDVRYSPAITAIEMLLAQNAHIQAYDPAAMDSMKKLFPTITYCPTAYDALLDADALVIMTEWNEFKYLDLKKVSEVMKGRIIVDMRNIFDQALMSTHKFIYSGVGVIPSKMKRGTNIDAS